MSEHDQENPRRDFLRKTLTLIPVVTVASTGLGMNALAATDSGPTAKAPNAPPVSDYQPSFFTKEEWAFVQAVVSRLIPADDLGPGALEAGAAEFIDRQMNTPYATGALWFMQGPFVTNAPAELGYQLQLTPQQLYRLGIAATDAWCKATYGKVFAAKDSATQDIILQKIESGEVVFDDFPVKAFFSLLVQNTREGFFCDPIHGGNKGMVGWTQIGFPGARADFMDGLSATSSTPSQQFLFVGRGLEDGDGIEKG